MKNTGTTGMNDAMIDNTVTDTGYPHIDFDPNLDTAEKLAKARRLASAINDAIDNAYCRAHTLALLTVAQPSLYDNDYTNAMAIIADIMPCETNPATGKLSKLQDTFHASATLTVGSVKEVTHVCAACARKWHHLKEQRSGIRWA